MLQIRKDCYRALVKIQLGTRKSSNFIFPPQVRIEETSEVPCICKKHRC